MYEQGAIRPPSEAMSLLVRVTRNCPWNQCTFCPAFKGATFSKRSVAEVKADIDAMVQEYGPHAGQLESAFLQDADSLMTATDQLIEIIQYIKERFPSIKRVTSYGRAKTLNKKEVQEYRELYAAGLSRIHTGLESGSLKVLQMVHKGSTPEEILQGGLRVKQSGISLSEYIMPGLGGKALSTEHAVETARLLNAIQPDFIRVRTFAMHPLSPMQKMTEQGSYVPMTDLEIAAEIRLLIENLDPIPSYFSCADFSLNLLMDVDGPLDRERENMLVKINQFLSLTPEQQKVFSFLQRTYPSHMQPVEVLKNEELVKKVLAEIKKLEEREVDGFNKYIARLMARQLPQPQTENWV
ncbi:MAG: radical SAM protein [Desulfobacteraceae bacterium]|nr:MAG: radical SAM protein [Desulfobacteraceae bacterium]